MVVMDDCTNGELRGQDHRNKTTAMTTTEKEVNATTTSLPTKRPFVNFPLLFLILRSVEEDGDTELLVRALFVVGADISGHNIVATMVRHEFWLFCGRDGVLGWRLDVGCGTGPDTKILSM